MLIRDAIMTVKQLDEEDIPKTPTCLVGVYGTLKKGDTRHGALGKDPIFRGDCTIPGIMFHEGGFPMVIQIPDDVKWRSSSRVEVEIWEIATPQIFVLDGIEGHPDYFRRTKIWDAQFGNFFTYYGADPYSKLKGKQRMITNNKWVGVNTRSIQIDFFDGKFETKPKIDLSTHHVYKNEVDNFSNTAEIAGLTVDMSTGEIQDIKMDHLSCVSTIGNPPHYQKRFYNSVTSKYQNEKGERLVYDHLTSNWVLESASKSNVLTIYTPPAPKEPDPPSVITVTKVERLNSPFPKIVTL